MSAITASMGIEIAKFRASLAEARSMLRDFKSNAQREGSGTGAAFSGGFGRFVGGVALGNLVADGLRSAVGQVREIGAEIGRQFAEGAKEAASAERIVMSFEILTGSRAGAESLFAELRADALRSGRGIDDMADSLKRFLAVGFSIPEAMQLNRSILDIAGSIGMSNDEARLLGSAVGQVAAKGVVSMEELRQQIAEKGVPVFEVLAEKMGLTTGEVIKLVGEGKVASNVLIEAFMNLEGSLGRFRGGMEKMAGTSGGAWGLVRAQIVDTRRELMAPINDAFTPILLAVRDAIAGLKTEIAAFGESVGYAVTFAATAFRELGAIGVGSLFATSLVYAFKSAVNFFASELMGVALMSGTAFVETGRFLAMSLRTLLEPGFWSGLGNVFAAIALDFRAGLLEAVAAMAETMRGLPIVGEGIGNLASGIRDQAGRDRLAADASRAGASGSLGDIWTELRNEFGAVVERVRGAREAGRASAPQLDTRFEEESIQRMMSRLHEAMERARTQPGPGQKGDDGSGGGGAAAKGGGVIGGFAQAINLAQGRTQAEVLADVANKQTEEQRKTNAKLDAANQTLARVATNLGMNRDVRVSVRPVWSGR